MSKRATDYIPSIGQWKKVQATLEDQEKRIEKLEELVKELRRQTFSR